MFVFCLAVVPVVFGSNPLAKRFCYLPVGGATRTRLKRQSSDCQVIDYKNFIFLFSSIDTSIDIILGPHKYTPSNFNQYPLNTYYE